MIDEKKLIEKLRKLEENVCCTSVNSFNTGYSIAIDKAIELAVQMDTIENDATFTNFKLYSDSTLLSMTKQELVEYIHMLYHDWGIENVCRVRLDQIINEMERSK